MVAAFPAINHIYQATFSKEFISIKLHKNYFEAKE